MANTFVQIGTTITVGSGGAADATFSSIPATFTDLKVVMSVRSSTTGVGTVRMGLNGNTSAIYNYRLIQGNGAAASSSFGTNAVNTANEVALNNGSDSTASVFSNSDIYFPNYAGASNKSWSADSVEEENATTAFMRLTAGLWANTSAITSISFTLSSGNFVQNSTFSLYGIKST